MKNISDYNDYPTFEGVRNHQGFTLAPGILELAPAKKGGDPFKLGAQNENHEQLTYALSRLSYLTAVIGAAGSGKTAYGVAAGIMGLKLQQYEHFIITRPTVDAEEDNGFQPGGELQKMSPYLMPIFENMIEMGYGEMIATLDDVRRDGDCTVGEQIMNRMIKPFAIAPLGTMRGRTFRNSFVMLDEAQNTTISQMKMFLTRLGVGSRGYICGDLTQIDTKYDNKDNGLRAVRELIQNSEGSVPLTPEMAHLNQRLQRSGASIPENDEMHLIEFGKTETQRGPGVARILQHL